jgi:hypothetical protein
VSSIYTEYVSSLRTDGTLPDGKLFDDVWAQLRKDVRRELGGRGLLDFPPSVLGIPGASWAEIMDELLQTVFVYVFVERLENLRNKLARSDPRNVDGIVLLQIRICLTDLQRRNDPIGYRVYELLHSAVTKSVADRELYVLDGKDGKVTNTTVLGFDPGTSPENPATPLDDEGVHRWLDDLLPDFMTARGSEVIPIVRRLRELVGELRNDGVEAFGFKDLVDPLKKETRRRWLAVYETTPTDGWPHRAADLHGLHCCVTGKIDLEGKKKTREGLARTWTFLRATQRDRNGQLPSNVKLAREIGVDRSRVPTLLETLKRLVAECLSGQGERR